MKLLLVSGLIGVVIRISIFLLVTSLALGANLRDRTYLTKRPELIARSLFAMIFFMPMLAVALSVVFNLSAPVTIGLVALSVSPVTPILPAKQIKAGGSADYAFALLIWAVLVSIVFVPAAIAFLSYAYGLSRVFIPPRNIAEIVLTSTLIPLGLGMFVRAKWPSFAERIRKPIASVAAVLLVFAVVPLAVVSLPAFRTVLNGPTLIAMIIFCAAGLLIGHLLGGPERENRTVLALSDSTRHPAIAVAIAKIGFPTEKTAIAAIILYVVVSAIVSLPYVSARRRAGRGAGTRAAPAAST